MIGRAFCLTLDLEADHGWKHQDCYDSLDEVKRLIPLLKKYKVPLTVFVTGEIIETKHYVLKELAKLPVEFELHTYSHGCKGLNEKEEISSAYKAYNDYFNRPPLIYRPSYGKISKKECAYLKKTYIGFISTMNNKKDVNDNELVDVPISHIRYCKIPMGLGWINFLGIKLFEKLLSVFGCTHPIVFYFHMHDLARSNMAVKLPFYWRLFYHRNKSNKFFDKLEFILDYFHKRDYNFMYMKDLCKL